MNLLGILKAPPAVAFAPFDAGINFRGSGAYITDGANEAYCVATDAFPVARGGFTFGWLTSPSSADRSNLVDRRLAGINYTQPTEERTFQLTLPAAGTYEIRFALGDQIGSGHIYAEVYDDSSLLFTVPDSTPAIAHFVDAVGADYTTLTWASSNTPATHTFATTTLKVKIGRASQSNFYTIAHLRVVRVG